MNSPPRANFTPLEVVDTHLDLDTDTTSIPSSKSLRFRQRMSKFGASTRNVFGRARANSPPSPRRLARMSSKLPAPGAFSIGGLTGGITGIFDPLTKPLVALKDDFKKKAEQAAAKKKVRVEES